MAGVTTDADAGSDGSARGATVTLRWTWDLGDATWSYESRARLTEDGGTEAWPPSPAP